MLEWLTPDRIFIIFLVLFFVLFFGLAALYTLGLYFCGPVEDEDSSYTSSSKPTKEDKSMWGYVGDAIDKGSEARAKSNHDFPWGTLG